MFHCSGCWETPCVCVDGRGYRHLSIDELETIKKAVTKLILDKLARRINPMKREPSPNFTVPLAFTAGLPDPTKPHAAYESIRGKQVCQRCGHVLGSADIGCV